jgi:hypothetical protein
MYFWKSLQIRLFEKQGLKASQGCIRTGIRSPGTISSFSHLPVCLPQG